MRLVIVCGLVANIFRYLEIRLRIEPQSLDMHTFPPSSDDILNDVHIVVESLHNPKCFHPFYLKLRPRHWRSHQHKFAQLELRYLSLVARHPYTV